MAKLSRRSIRKTSINIQISCSLSTCEKESDAFDKDPESERPIEGKSLNTIEGEWKAEQEKKKNTTEKLPTTNSQSSENSSPSDNKPIVPCAPARSWNYARILPVTFIVICLVSILYLACTNSNTSTTDASVPLNSVEECLLMELKSMEEKFPKQAENVWMSLMAAITSILKDEPDQPAILLLIGSKLAKVEKTMQCFAWELATAVNKVCNRSTDVPSDLEVNIQELTLRHTDEDIMKEAVDTKMKTILHNSSSVVVSNIQELAPRSALVFHGHCDNTMAPLKQRVIILTALFDTVVEEYNDSSLQRHVDRQLRRLWDDELGPDKAGSIVSRIGNYPVLIEPEIGNGECF